MLDSLLRLGAFIALLNTCGILLDRLLLRQQKADLHLVFIRWWERLHETRVPDIARLMATWTLKHYDRLSTSDKQHGFKAVLKKSLYYLFASIILTTVTSLGWCILFQDSLAGFALPYCLYYICNFVFDLFTLLVTIHILRIVRDKGLLLGIVVILCDVALACLFAAGCYASFGIAGLTVDRYDLPFVESVMTPITDEVVQELETILESSASFPIKELTVDVTEGRDYIEDLWTLTQKIGPALRGRKLLPSKASLKITLKNEAMEISIKLRQATQEKSLWIWLSATTLVPTLLYLAFLGTMLLSKTFLEALKYVAIHYFERATDADPISHPEKFIPVSLFTSLVSMVVIAAYILMWTF